MTARLFAITRPLPAAKKEIARLAATLTPAERPGDFAQALMDLGATICTPRAANCDICPWTEYCEGRKRGLVDGLPRKLPKAKIPTRKGIVFWIERRDGHVLLRRRPQKGLLGGMMEVPSTPWTARFPANVEPPMVASWKKLAVQVEYTFTHFHLELNVWKAMTAETSLPEGDYSWVHLRDIGHEALPSLMRKVVALAAPANLVDVG